VSRELAGRRVERYAMVRGYALSTTTYLRWITGGIEAKIRTTNVLERLFKEVKRRTRVGVVFPNETNTQTLATEIVLRSSSEEEWALKRYLIMEVLEGAEETKPTPFETLTFSCGV
jgi:putative transposase